LANYQVKAIPLKSLRLNLENYRYAHQPSERAALETLAKEQGIKLFNLAEHIAGGGLNPTDLPIVTSIGGELYSVLEGNRRVAAMKLASEPKLAGSLDSTEGLKKRFAGIDPSAIPADVVCAVMPPEDAETWIGLKHTGENDGVGIVPWNGVQRARFRGGSAATMAAELVASRDLLDEVTRQKLETMPITNLSRLLGTPEAREALGVEIKNDKLEIVGPEEETLRRLAHVIADIAHGRKKVTDLDSKEQRVKYAQEVAAIPVDELPKHATIPEKSRVSTRKKRRVAPVRNTIIPKSLRLRIAHTRLNAIYDELQRLPLDRFLNSAAAMLRVFVELSADDYAKRHRLASLQGRGKPGHFVDLSLRQKLTAIADDLEKRQKASKHELRGIRTLTSQKNHVLSVDSLNAYLHNKDFSPAPSDLKATWDSIERFVEAVST
jgi:hypothetical protein